MRWRGLTLVLIGASLCAAAPKDKARRIAVLEFQNVTQNKTLDWMGTGIKEELTSQLGQIPDLVIVERARLGDALKELNFNRSQYVDPAAAQKMGKMLGAQSVVVGSYQKFEETMRIHARVVDVETGEVKSPIRVDGPYKNFLDLENEVAKKLVAEMKGSLSDSDRKQLETAPTSNLDAHRVFSDGVYFLRNDLVDDALAQFDKAVAADPNYGEAWFYKGLALEKKQKWDDAVAALKRALPRSQSVRYDKWTWRPPFDPAATYHGRLNLTNQQDWLDAGQARPTSRVSFVERSGKQVIVHYVDLERKNADRFVIDDPGLNFGASLSNGSRMVLFSPPASFVLLETDTRRTWRRTEKGLVLPGLFDRLMVMIDPGSRKISALDPETGAERWQLQVTANMTDLVGANPFTTMFYDPAKSLILLQGAPGQLEAIRTDTGAVVWSASLAGRNAALLARDGLVVALPPEGRASAFALETGRPIALPELEAGTARRDITGLLAMFGNVLWSPSLLRDRVLYLWTKDKALAAVDLKPETKTELRMLWRLPMENAPRSIVAEGNGLFVSTDAGEIFSFDAATGKQRGLFRPADQALTIAGVGQGILLAGSADAVYGVDAATGRKKWDYPNRSAAKDLHLFQGAAVFQSGAHEITCLDAQTGSPVWRHTGNGSPQIHFAADRLFVSDDDRVLEYEPARQAVTGIADKEVYTELARTVLLQGDAKGAQVYARKVLEELDPNYAPARLVESRILKAQADSSGAGRDLAAFLLLEGSGSQAGREALAELQKEHALLWQANVPPPVGVPFELQGKIVSMQGATGEDLWLAAYDSSGASWRHPGQRFLQATPDYEGRRVLYATGRQQNPRVIDVFQVAVENGARKKVATVTLSQGVNSARVAYAAGKVYVGAATGSILEQKPVGEFVAIDVAAGKTLWQKARDLPAIIEGAAVGFFYARNNSVVYSMNNDLWLLSATDGTELAHQTEAAGFNANNRSYRQEDPAFSVPGHTKDLFYYATGAREIVAYDLAQKAVRWRAKVPAQVAVTSISPDLFRNGVTLGFGSGSLVALRVPTSANGDMELIWKSEPAAGKRYREFQAPGAKLIARRSDNVLVEIDPATGKPLKEYPLLWEPENLQARVVQDAVYVFTADGTAYAVRLNK